MASVSALYVYPIKSCGEVPLEVMEFDELGPRLDRRWMIVDRDGKFVTQRTVPALGTVSIKLHPDGLKVSALHMPELEVPLLPAHSERTSIQVWGYQGEAIECGAQAAEWFSECIQQSVRLVQFPPDRQRWVNEKYSPEPRQVGFADGYPVLVVTQASLDDLSLRVGQNMNALRFRPNIVISGTEAYADDSWRRVRIDQRVLEFRKPCERCSVTTIDPETRDAAKEPLQGLSRYRRQGGQVIFGQNCTVSGGGPIQLNHEIIVID